MFRVIWSAVLLRGPGTFWETERPRIPFGFRGLEAADQLVSTGRWTPGTGPRDEAGNEAHVALGGGLALAHDSRRAEAGEGHVGGVAANGRAKVRRRVRRHLNRAELHDHTSYRCSSGAGVVSPRCALRLGTRKLPRGVCNEQSILWVFHDFFLPVAPEPGRWSAHEVEQLLAVLLELLLAHTAHLQQLARATG